MSIEFKKNSTGPLFRIRRAVRSLPSPSQCLRLPYTLNKKEKIIFLFLLFVFISSSCFLLRSLYLSKTSLQPAQGGTLREGAVGQPRFVNPVLASSDPDRDLVEITFSGLMRYNSQGEIVKELIQDYNFEQEKGAYEVTLKQDIFWSDGEAITADDVVFTVNTIQDPAYKSPENTNWMGVKAEALSDKKVRFSLSKPYFPFRERMTLKIIPKHIFEKVSPEEFALSPYNLQQVVCSGPYKIKEIEQNGQGRIERVVLEQNERYHGSRPHIQKIQFSFFKTQKEALDSFNKGGLDGLAVSDPAQNQTSARKGISYQEALSPRYFGIFFNLEQNPLFKKREVRSSLYLALDKKEIVKEAVGKYGETVYSPILPEIYGFDPVQKTPEQDIEKAASLLREAGLIKENGKWTEKPEPEFEFESRLEKGEEGEEVKNLQQCLSRFEDVYPEKEVTSYFGNKTEEAVIRFQEKYKEDILSPWGFDEGTGIVSKTTRAKLNQVCNESQSEPVKLTVSTVDQGFLARTAEAVKDDWEELGFEVEVKRYSFNQITRNVIKERGYEILLFGEMLGMIPDPFPFWHSSQIQDPGLNLSFYENEEVDEFLEKARAARDEKEFRGNLEKFQDQFLKDRPALLLYSPKLHYMIDQRIKGVEINILAEPCQRFNGLENWYIKTKRRFK